MVGNNNCIGTTRDKTALSRFHFRDNQPLKPLAHFVRLITILALEVRNAIIQTDKRIYTRVVSTKVVFLFCYYFGGHREDLVGVFKTCDNPNSISDNLEPSGGLWAIKCMSKAAAALERKRTI